MSSRASREIPVHRGTKQQKIIDTQTTETVKRPTNINDNSSSRNPPINNNNQQRNSSQYPIVRVGPEPYVEEYYEETTDYEQMDKQSDRKSSSAPIAITEADIDGISLTKPNFYKDDKHDDPIRHIDSVSSLTSSNDSKRFIYSHDVYVDPKTGKPYTPGTKEDSKNYGRLKINVYFKPPNPPKQYHYVVDEVEIEKPDNYYSVRKADSQGTIPSVKELNYKSQSRSSTPSRRSTKESPLQTQNKPNSTSRASSRVSIRSDRTIGSKLPEVAQSRILSKTPSQQTIIDSKENDIVQLVSEKDVAYRNRINRSPSHTTISTAPSIVRNNVNRQSITSKSSILKPSDDIEFVPLDSSPNSRKRSSVNSTQINNSTSAPIKSSSSERTERNIPIQIEEIDYDKYFPKMSKKRNSNPSRSERTETPRKYSPIEENHKKPMGHRQSLPESLRDNSKPELNGKEKPGRKDNKQQSYVEEVVHLKERYERDETIRRYYPTTTV